MRQALGKSLSSGPRMAMRSQIVEATAKRGTKQSDDRYAHREPAAFDARIERIALDHRVETVFGGPGDFLNDGRRLDDMRQAVERLRFAENLMHHGARKIIGETIDDLGSRRRISTQQRFDFGNVFVGRAGIARTLVEKHDAHGVYLSEEFSGDRRGLPARRHFDAMRWSRQCRRRRSNLRFRRSTTG